jgi:hypothetical protein
VLEELEEDAPAEDLDFVLSSAVEDAEEDPGADAEPGAVEAAEEAEPASAASGEVAEPSTSAFTMVSPTAGSGLPAPPSAEAGEAATAGVAVEAAAASDMCARTVELDGWEGPPLFPIVIHKMVY